MRLIDRDKLWEKFVKHEWWGISKDRDLILSHIIAVLQIMPNVCEIKDAPETNFELVVTDFERNLASEAIVEGHYNCQMTKFMMDPLVEKCDCDFGAIDGCKARLEAIAKVIATARKM